MKLTKYCFCLGSGRGNTELNAFDSALLNAGIGDFNLLKVSSILPPGAIETKKINLPKGSLLPIAYSSKIKNFEDVFYRNRINGYAGVGVGLPVKKDSAGVIMEHFSKGTDEKYLIEKIESMIIEGMNKRSCSRCNDFNFSIRTASDETYKQTSVGTGNFHCVFAGIALF